jgi:pimeloyl-ACP methyl ester carboxylesterase
MTSPKALTPTRIVGLAAIAVVVAGLVFLRFASGGDAVSVPSGAHAGQLTLKPCQYQTERGALPADCGTLTVPENRADPRSRLIALPVTRIRARTDKPGPPVFRLEGGPGRPNMKFPAASRFNDDRDVVLLGYRGVEGSQKLDCPEVTDAMRHSSDQIAKASLDARARAFRECSERLQDEGVDLAGYTLPQRVDDFEAARRAFGYGRVNLLSESMGTRVAMIYAWRYPRSVHRSVMVAVNPPGRFLWDPATMQAQLGRYARLGGREGVAAIRRDDIPHRWGPFRIKAGTVRVASFFGLMESTSKSQLNGPATLDAWRAAARGDASGLWLYSVMGDMIFPRAWVWGDVAAVGRVDAAAGAEHFAHKGRHPGTDLVWNRGQLLDAWPGNHDDNAYSRVQRSDVPTLLIGGTLDFATPVENATRELLPHLPNGHQVVLRDLGHTEDFWHNQTAAGRRLVNTFLDSGKVDASGYRKQPVEFTPKTTQTGVAKGIATVLVGLAGITLLSLLLMAGRVHRRGRLGRKTAAVVRSVYVLVLGLGGWCLGALIVLIAFPTVPLDSEGIATLSIGVPIALGTYLAWLDRERCSKTGLAGLAAASAGALLGAWLGFGSAEGFAAILTTILGAAAASNLMLIATDLADQARAAAPVGASQSASTSIGAAK